MTKEDKLKNIEKLEKKMEQLKRREKMNEFSDSWDSSLAYSLTEQIRETEEKIKKWKRVLELEVQRDKLLQEHLDDLWEKGAFFDENGEFDLKKAMDARGPLDAVLNELIVLKDELYQDAMFKDVRNEN